MTIPSIHQCNACFQNSLLNNDQIQSQWRKNIDECPRNSPERLPVCVLVCHFLPPKDETQSRARPTQANDRIPDSLCTWELYRIRLKNNFCIARKRMRNIGCTMHRLSIVSELEQNLIWTCSEIKSLHCWKVDTKNQVSDAQPQKKSGDLEVELRDSFADYHQKQYPLMDISSLAKFHKWETCTTIW